jgi:hypothetical protein
MTIKQQGGIFGRNPTFNEVNVEGGLSVEGEVNVEGGLSVDGSSYTYFKENDSNIGSVFVTGDKIGIGTLNNGIAFDQSSNIILPFNPQTLLKRDGELDLGYAAGKFKDLYLSGNVIVDSGLGIDFSATSGTGTSELFDDYEEGTWTGTLIGVTTAGLSPTATGNYTKVGDRVHAYITFSAVDTTGAAGNIRVTGLPFTSSSSTIGTCYNSRGPASITIASVPTSNTFISQINYAGSSQDWASSGTTYAAFAITYKA